MVTTYERVNRLRNETRQKPELCIERAILFTESYKETEGQPEIIRRAKSLEKLLRKMTIRIEDDELLVGDATSKRVAGPMLPEVQWEWYWNELDTISSREMNEFKPLSADEKARTREALSYWKGKCLYDKWVSIVPDEFRRLKEKSWAPGGANPYVGIHLAHCCPGFDRVPARWI